MSMFRGLLNIESHAAGRENEIGNMVPQTCIKVFFQTSPEFLEEIGFMNTVPSGGPTSILARAQRVFPSNRFLNQLGNTLQAKFLIEVSPKSQTLI